MILQSKTIASFIQRLELYAKQILEEEMSIKVLRKRFVYHNYRYPLHIVVFEKEQLLGQFDPQHLQIGIHKKLLYQADTEVLKNILRHELAHYICFIKYGDSIQSHGAEFRQECKRCAWGEQVYRAKTDLLTNPDFSKTDIRSEKIIQKVQKLLALSQSNNENEAKLATAKANQLLLQHNLQYIEQLDDKEYALFTLRSSKRRNALLDALYLVIGHFLVRPIFNYGRASVKLDIMGSRENINMASYVADFLEKEFETLWKTQTKLKGLRAKNSFYRGLARGFSLSIEQNNAHFHREHQKALVAISKELDSVSQAFFPRLSSVNRNFSQDTKAYETGKQQGQTINLRPGLKNKDAASKRLGLSWP